ncbi:TetR/AcrR family transcriptional regulator [Streptosporangium pseudovulgare]|uniref:TetR family transcriptional regulator n=1 Tax=Streptosporangium pseudovulgare TaxID=35765 RepID=A0ABQ2QGR5_9ACTN|nr:TetR/AcrR family transcriptional regulator [Streptosporangium pseudovulgare]GGP81042.1 TetR family transcriptional regulator [Streptosporangium pseudovulgare]
MPNQRRGAPRSESARLAILQATARLFAQRGYEHLSIEGIAAEAGVSKQTIYRWWPAKSDLVADCLLDGMLLPSRLTIPDTGDLRADLIAWLEQLFQLLQEPDGRGLMISLIAAATANEQIGGRLRDSLGGESSLVARLATGVEAGQLRDDAPVAELGEALVGAMIVKALSGRPGESADAVRLVDALLVPPD